MMQSYKEIETCRAKTQSSFHAHHGKVIGCLEQIGVALLERNERDYMRESKMASVEELLKTVAFIIS